MGALHLVGSLADTNGSMDPANVAALSPLEHVRRVFRDWLDLPDDTPLLAVMGAMAANRLTGDPVWLVLVGPPSSGKTELLQAFADIKDVYPAATMTEAALLSGTAAKERTKGASGGLLRELGDFGVLLCKDFGSILSMHREARAQVLAALREIYDGSWTRHVGVDGGKTLAWTGKLGFIAGCTPTIDRHHAVMAQMGERLLLLRMPPVNEDLRSRRSLTQPGTEPAMRAAFSAAVAKLMDETLRREPRKLSEDEETHLVELAKLVARCRSAVERDGYSREIALIPEPEVSTRLCKQLDRLLAGLDALRVERTEALRIVTTVALDSIPALRRKVITILRSEQLTLTQLAQRIHLPQTTVKRQLQDLGALKVVVHKSGPVYRLSPWTQEQLGVCLPEMSAGKATLSVAA